MKVNNVFNTAFKQGGKIVHDSHYSTLAIAAAGVALFIFGSSLCIPCFTTVTGYLFTKSFLIITERYKMINFDQLKKKILLMQQFLVFTIKTGATVLK